MKHSVVVFLFILSNSLFSQSPKWQIQPTDFTNDLYKLYFTDSLTGYICGENGIILKTTDGNNWTQKQTPTNNTLRDIFFLRDTLGWACGDSGTIIHTMNGGETWEIQPTYCSRQLVSIEFYDYETGYTGWAVGDSVGLLKLFTSEWTGGSDTIGCIYHFVTYQKPTVFIALFMCYDVLWSTPNNGMTWTFIKYFGKEQFSSAKRISYNITNWSNNFWTVGEDGSAWYCDQPYFGWPIYQSLTPDTLDLYGVAVDEYAHNIWAVGVNGRILLSNNEGLSYNLFESPTSETLNDIYFSGFNTGYIVGNIGMILVYKDNWVVSDESKDSEKQRMIFPNPATNNIYIDLGHYSDIQVSIYNSTGERIIFQLLPSSQTIDVSCLPAGIYIYLLTGKNGFKETGKIVIR
jgi:photosystem II stability/assembly factor-like uncharacterized protein